MRSLVASMVFFCVGANAAAIAQPRYVAKLLGDGTVINDMNVRGEVVGWTVAGGAVRAFVVGPAHTHQLLPLPSGFASAWAQGINDSGVIVGSVGAGSLPEFGKAIAWTPNGQGGYSTQLLGQLPGHSQSVAYAINDRGQIVGSSLTPGFQGGPTVWFNSPTGVMNIAALGAPSDPKQVNTHGVVVGINGGLFDLDTLTPSPLPSLTGNMSGFQGWAINSYGEMAGTGFYGGVARAATRFTLTQGWQALSAAFSLSSNVQAFDINDHRLTVLEAPFPSAHFDGIGTFGLGSILVPTQAGGWSFGTSFGGAVNDFDQIAAIGSKLGPGGGSGVVLLTPAGFHDVGFGLAGSNGIPQLSGTGSLVAGTPMSATLSNAVASSPMFLVVGTNTALLPFLGGTLVPTPQIVLGGFTTDPAGSLVVSTTWPAGIPVGTTVSVQAWIADPTATAGYAASNGLWITQP